MSASKELLGLAESLVAYGKQKGADQVEVLIGDGSEFSVDVREGNVEKLVEAGSKELNLKVILDQRVATASSSDLSTETLHRLVDNAIERAKLSNQDEFAGLPAKEEITAKVADLKIYDAAIVGLAPEKKIARAREIEAICRGDKRIQKSYGANFSTNVGATILANSNGFGAAYEGTFCSCGVQLQAGTGDNLFDEGKFDFASSLSGLMAPEALAKEAIHRVTRLIGARKVPTQDVPVVLEPEMSSELLQFFLNCVQGSSVYRKQTFLADKIGTKVAHERVSIVDDGLMPGVPGAKPFDREGVPTRRTAVIDKGVLKSYLLDTYAARKLKMQPTGNASGANNLFLVAGTSSPADIIRSVDRGLLLTGTIGFGLVPTTGDISRGAFGMWIEGGEIAYPVAEITIAGNLGTMLQGMEMIGNDLEYKRFVSGPTIKVASMTIGGTA